MRGLRKKIMSALAVLTLLMFGGLTDAHAFTGTGSGTEADPYIITNAEQLQQMNDDRTAHYALGNNIDASATAGWDGDKGFGPIGTVSDPFTGSLDGRGYVIIAFGDCPTL